jgi:hypothetical protein
LSRRDTLLQFLQRLCGTQRLARALAANGLALSRMVAGRADGDVVKDALLVRVLAGRDAEEVAAAGATYAQFLLDHGGLRADTCIAWRSIGPPGTEWC